LQQRFRSHLVAELPTEALLDYAEVLAVLESQPWSGRPQHESNPGTAVRYRREVHLLLVQWPA
jgi:hypothetical protein